MDWWSKDRRVSGSVKNTEMVTFGNAWVPRTFQEALTRQPEGKSWNMMLSISGKEYNHNRQKASDYYETEDVAVHKIDGFNLALDEIFSLNNSKFF